MTTSIAIEPVELLIRVALGTNGAGEQPVATNSGPYVERVQRAANLKKGDPWCAAQIADWGKEALKDRWPVPGYGGCQILFEWCAKKGIIRTEPERGDLFVIWHPELKPAARFGHVGLYLGPNDTISGNTTWPKDPGVNDPKLAREGWCVARKPWAFKSADRFIRWRLLLT